MKSILLSLILVISLTACSSVFLPNEIAESENDMFGRLYNTDKQQANDQLQQIIQIAEARNTDAMRKLFSVDTIDSVEDINAQIQAFFEFYEGSVVSCTSSGPGSRAERNNNTYYKEIFTTYDVSTTAGNYRIAFLFCTIDSENAENIGIKSIYIIRAENSDMNYAYWGDKKWMPGITIQGE